MPTVLPQDYEDDAPEPEDIAPGDGHRHVDSHHDCPQCNPAYDDYVSPPWSDFEVEYRRILLRDAGRVALERRHGRDRWAAAGWPSAWQIPTD